MTTQGTQDRFWMVWNPNGTMPRVRHNSFQSAEFEARRLARKVPGQDFFVFKCVSGFRAEIQEPARIKIKKQNKAGGPTFRLMIEPDQAFSE